MRGLPVDIRTVQELLLLTTMIDTHVLNKVAEVSQVRWILPS